MRLRHVSLVAVAAASLLPIAAMGANYELKGLTTSSFDGDQGIFGFTVACQAEFGSDTRMCDSIEVMETINLPSLPASGIGWVRPSIVARDANGVWDASGQGFTDLSCINWSTNSASQFGLFFADALGGGGSGTAGYIFGSGSCANVLAVACCGPVPAPALAAVPSMLWFGRGLLAALILSAAARVVLFRGRPVLGSGVRALGGRG